MTFTAAPLFPGLLYDSARRLAADVAGGPGGPAADPVAAMGWPGLLIAEKHGGAGGNLADLASIVEGLATQALHLPVIERCAIVPALLQGATTGEGSTTWLHAVADGSAVVAPLASAPDDLAETGLRAQARAGNFCLAGRVDGAHVPDGATHCIVIARLAAGDDAEGEPSLFLLPADALPPAAQRYTAVDGLATADFELEGVNLKADALLAVGEPAAAAIRRAGDLALAATCVDMVATLGRLLELTIEHLNDRIQFGVALSTFQVLRHRAVDVYLRYESSRGMAAQLVRSGLAQGRDHERLLRLSKVSIGESARFAAEAAIQLHGGMGMSQEVLAARLAQRLLASEFRYGDRLFHGTSLLASRPVL